MDVVVRLEEHGNKFRKAVEDCLCAFESFVLTGEANAGEEAKRNLENARNELELVIQKGEGAELGIIMYGQILPLTEKQRAEFLKEYFGSNCECGDCECGDCECDCGECSNCQCDKR